MCEPKKNEWKKGVTERRLGNGVGRELMLTSHSAFWTLVHPWLALLPQASGLLPLRLSFLLS